MDPGAGGGAIQLKAAGKIKIEPNVILSANGGNGVRSSASGAGGSIRLDGQSIENLGRIEAKAGEGVKLSAPVRPEDLEVAGLHCMHKPRSYWGMLMWKVNG